MRANRDFDPRKAAKKLIRERLTGALATLLPSSGGPYCSLVNVATAHDGSPLLLISKLALHTKNLLADPRASLMLDERKEGDPLEGARVTLMGRVTPTDDPKARSRYLARHPEAEQFAHFADFAICRMEIDSAHLVAGFGRIVDLGPSGLVTDLTGAEALIEAEPQAVAHMNSDHRDALALYATRLLGAPAGEWRCTGCDPEGLDMRLGSDGLRLSFPQAVRAPGSLRAVLKELAEQARTR
jgi:heme iron utilization protein